MRVFVFASVFLGLSLTLSAQTAPSQTRPHRDATTGQPSSSQIDPEKEANIRRLIEISGAKRNFEAGINNMSTMMRASLEKSGMNNDKARQFSDLVFEKMQTKMTAQFGGLLDSLIPVYDKYYSNEDIEGLLQFYETPLGQKLLKTTPDLLRESQNVGFQWGSKIGQDSVREVLAEHPELKPPTSGAISNQ